MTDIAASIGIHQLKKAWEFQRCRQQMAIRYDKTLCDLPVLLPPQPPVGETHAWHLYVLRLASDAPVKRDHFIELMANMGIGTSVHFIPLHLHPYWRDRYNLKITDFPQSQQLFEQSVSLPLYSKLAEIDQEAVIAAVRSILS
jgi:dTDP-4-amino-4,6-dideoxygalactose transaminase